MLAESNGSSYAGGDTPKLRTACENCRQSKVKCNLSSKNICTRCLHHGLQCQYGFANRSGKPKGSKNRATLRKLGQLQDDKPPTRGLRGGRAAHPLSDNEPIGGPGYSGHIALPVTEDDLCLVPSPTTFWESPRSLGDPPTLESPICPSQLMAVDGSPFTDLGDTCPVNPINVGYPHTPVTPTFLSPEAVVDGIPSPSFAASLSSPFPTAPCDCVDMQLFHLNRLNNFLAEPLPLRFDHSLQAIKAAYCTNQAFLQCGKCVKDSTNLLLTISVLNLTLQIFEFWISRETSRTMRIDPDIDIRYGYYEICPIEHRKIRLFLLRGLLLHCQAVLALLTTAVNTVCIGASNSIDSNGSESSGLPIEKSRNQAWTSTSEHFVNSMPDEDPGALDLGSGNNCLLPIIAGYEATVEAFLDSISTYECICGSNSMGDESLSVPI